MRKFILFLLFICFSIACKHEKVEEVDKEVLELANKGDMNAQYVLGCYYYDQGEIEKATLWWEKSANQGNTEAQCSLGDNYYEEDEIEKAMYWYTKAAEQGI